MSRHKVGALERSSGFCMASSDALPLLSQEQHTSVLFRSMQKQRCQTFSVMLRSVCLLELLYPLHVAVPTTDALLLCKRRG